MIAQKVLSMSYFAGFADQGVSINAISLGGRPRLLMNEAGSMAEDQKFT